MVREVGICGMRIESYSGSIYIRWEVYKGRIIDNKGIRGLEEGDDPSEFRPCQRFNAFPKSQEDHSAARNYSSGTVSRKVRGS